MLSLLLLQCKFRKTKSKPLYIVHTTPCMPSDGASACLDQRYCIMPLFAHLHRKIGVSLLTWHNATVCCPEPFLHIRLARKGITSCTPFLVMWSVVFLDIGVPCRKSKQLHCSCPHLSLQVPAHRLYPTQRRNNYLHAFKS